MEVDLVEKGVTYSTLREINCTLHWFKSWTTHQKEIFMNDLVSKVHCDKVEFLLGAMENMGVDDKSPRIFDCQLRLFTQWFNEWDTNEKNFMLERLETVDPLFISNFYQKIRS